MTAASPSEATPRRHQGRQPIWLASYPAGVPATIDPDAYPSLPAMLIEACRQHHAAPGLRMPGRADELTRNGSATAATLRPSWSRRRTAAGRPRRDHAAEHARLSGHVPRRAARRHDGGQRQPALHAARIARSSSPIPAPTSSSSWRISPTSCRTSSPTRKIRHVVVARLGDFVPMLKRWAFNFANSYIRHAVPAWHFETFTMLQDACDRPPSEHYEDAPARRATSRSCNIPAAPPACRKARC